MSFDVGRSAPGMAVSPGPKVRAANGSPRLAIRALSVAWWAVFTTTVALFVALFPVRHFELTDTFGNLSPAQELVLQEMGVLVAEHSLWVLGIEMIVPVVFIALAALIYLRKPSDKVAVFVAISLVGFVAFLDPLFDTVSATDSPLYMPSMIIQAVGWVSAIVFFLVFPNGRFVPNWSRYLVPVLAISATIWVLVPSSPFNLSDLYRLPLPVFLADLVPWFVGAGAQIHRFVRVATPVERQQTKLALFGISITFVSYFLFAFDRFANPILARPTFAAVVYDLIGVPVFLIVSLLIPASLAASIFRYRLWDIDVLIGRTLVYGALTAVLAGLYTASIGLSQRLFVAFTGSKSDAAVVFTTLIVASAFTPVKSALQGIVDRRFRLQTDPMARVDAFRERIQGFAELMDTTALTSRALEEAVAGFGATGGAVYLSEDGRVRRVHSHGESSPTEGMSAWLPIDDRRRQRLVLYARCNGHEYDAEDRQRFADYAALVGRTIELVERTEQQTRLTRVPRSSPDRDPKIANARGNSGRLML